MSSEVANTQHSFLSQLISDYEYYQELVESDVTISKCMLTSLQKECETIISQARANHSQLVNNKKPSEIVQKYLADDVFTSIRRKYHIYWSALEERMVRERPLDTTLNATNITDMPGGSRAFRIKLPILTIPSFAGDIRKWKTFYNSFVSLVDENQNLSGIDKFRYLLNSLESEAKSLVNHLDLEESNYQIALKLLKDRYDHKRILVNVQLNTIYNLEPIKKESSTNIRQMIDTLREGYQSLNVLGVDVKAWDPVIIFLVQHKLPQNLNQLWEERLSNSKELPNFQQFQDFLECRFRTLDVLTTRTGQNSSQVFHVQSNNSNFNNSPSCPLGCNQSHFITYCKKFLDADPMERYSLVTQNHLCINCLSKYHMLNDCSSKRTCRKCNKRHNTFLHREFNSNQRSSSQGTSNSQSQSKKFNKSKNKPRNNQRNQARNNNNDNNQQSSNTFTTLSAEAQSFVQTPTAPPLPNASSYHINSLSGKTFLLGTAVVQVKNDRGHFRTVRALIDPGSEDNYVVDTIVTGLPLKKYYAPSSISVIGGQMVEGITHRCDFTIKSLHNDFELKVDAGIKGAITPDLPKEQIPGLCYNFLNNLQLADSSFDEPGEIHLLLGMGVWVQIAQPGLVKSESLMAQKTTLGWMVQGVTEQRSSGYQSQPSRCHTTLSLENQMQKFWELEKIETGGVLDTPENSLCEQIVLNSIKQLEDKRLSVDLPFRDATPPTLGRSKEIARNRFYNLEKRLNQNSKLKAEYHKTIKEYIDLGHMKPIEDREFDGKEYYLPHHAVFKESSTTTKVRVVFDASCKTYDSTSLNDHLLTGRKLQIDIRDILLRWRQYPYVFSADVEKMYRQFWVNDHHHKYQKVLWRFNNEEPLKSYVLTTVTFGTSAAPYLALRLLLYIANSEASKQFPLASRAINSDFYVDDLLSGSYSCEDAINTQTQIRELLEKFGLPIRKWCSNDVNTLRTIPSDLCDITEHSFDETDFKKTLGIYWSPSKDSFAFSVEPLEFGQLKLTKRKTLSLIARLYDPLGWLGPCTTYAKVIMQRVWQSSVGWDDEIPDNIKSQFRFFLEDLQKLNSLSIPRWIQLESCNSPITLLGFADASEVGFGCVIYLKLSSESEKNILLTSRSRVAPLNFTTIARLELCAALLLAEVLEWCEELFKGRKITVYAFSDSKIVLSWLQSHPTRWKTFVANRTAEILQRYDRTHWHYINTKENPADFISRGLLPSEIISSDLWWNGPKKVDLDQPFSLVSEEEQKIMQHETKKLQNCFRIQHVDTSLVTYFSSNTKLFKRIYSICSFVMKCLLKCCKTNPIKQQRYLEIIQTLQNPEHVVLRLVQNEAFHKEIQMLKQKLPISKDSKIRSVSPFIDGFGILRSGSRLENASILTYEQKYPAILPSSHQFTLNIIHEAHAATLHGSFKLTFAYIRNKFHILRGTEKIKGHIRRCVNCIRYARIQQNQLMGSLPFPRVNQNKPFLFTGVDFAGPILIRNKNSRGSKTSKAYISIFVCLCTKALHIELVSDLSSEAFLAAFRRFISRRGRCQSMFSDCGSNFKGASKIMETECHQAQVSWRNDLQPTLSELGVNWEFNPPASPHFGGLWEAGVKSVKSHLHKTLKDAILTFEEFYTFLVQVEGILNSRPLCPISDNPDHFEALTPSHFLVGEAIVVPPESKIENTRVSLIKRWRHIQYLQQRFWSQWQQSYLYTLSQRPKWLEINRNFQIDDLVLLTEDNFAPTIWPLARIIETHPGHDGMVRVVTLKTAEGKIFKRPIAKLRFLPISTQEENQQNTDQNLL